MKFSIELERWLFDRQSAAKGLDKDEEDKEGKYIRKERYAGNAEKLLCR